jgi:hypothetical protein
MKTFTRILCAFTGVLCIVPVAVFGGGDVASLSMLGIGSLFSLSSLII